MNEKILIVDDEKYICSVMAAYLEEQGFKVFEATDVKAARQHLENGVKPDLVVSDMALGEISGVVFLKEIRQSPETKQIPVILMSAHQSNKKEKNAGADFTADDYLLKPFDLRELHLRIMKLLKPTQKSINQPTK